MTAAQAVALGPSAFEAWIDDQVYGHRRMRTTLAGRISRVKRDVHRALFTRSSAKRRAKMKMGWQFAQPMIGWMRRNPEFASFIVSSVLALVMLWKVNTR